MTFVTRDLLFKETIRIEARGYHKLKKQNGGPGQFAVVDLRLRPLPRGAGFRFLNSVVEARIPEEFMPSIEKGAREALSRGVVAGFPVVDVEVDVLDGERHRKDSHARDFQTAGRSAVQDALKAGSPAVLEPFGAFEITCPTPALGAVLGQLQGRRARIRGQDFRDGRHVIQGEVPLLELSGWESDLRSVTSGSGTLTLTYAYDELMPERITSLFLEQRRQSKD
jgi:elongation factor G